MDANKKRPSPTGEEPPAKRPKLQDQLTGWIDHQIEQLEKVDEEDAARKRDAEDLRVRFGDRIHTLRAECSPHGTGWVIEDGSIALRPEFCADMWAPTGPSNLELKNLTALKKHAAANAHTYTAIPVVWFEEITDPMTVWQVVHFAADDEAANAVHQFYKRYRSRSFPLPGLYYTGSPRWINELKRDRINLLCTHLGHAPMFIEK